MKTLAAGRTSAPAPRWAKCTDPSAASRNAIGLRDAAVLATSNAGIQAMADDIDAEFPLFRRILSEEDIEEILASNDGDMLNDPLVPGISEVCEQSIAEPSLANPSFSVNCINRPCSTSPAFLCPAFDFKPDGDFRFGPQRLELGQFPCKAEEIIRVPVKGVEGDDAAAVSRVIVTIKGNPNLAPEEYVGPRELVRPQSAKPAIDEIRASISRIWSEG